MTLLDLVLISFSTYFTFSVLSECSIPNTLRKSSLAICIISFINVILVSSFSNLDLIYFSLAAAGIAYLFVKILPSNIKDSLIHQKKPSNEAEHKKPMLNNDSPQTQLIDNHNQREPALKTVNDAVNTANTAKAKQQPRKNIQPTIKNQSPIVTRIVTMQAPMTFNEFYKEASDSKMLLSDELVKKLTGEKNNRQ